jgi:hypothetical protein
VLAIPSFLVRGFCKTVRVCYLVMSLGLYESLGKL